MIANKLGWHHNSLFRVSRVMRVSGLHVKIPSFRRRMLRTIIYSVFKFAVFVLTHMSHDQNLAMALVEIKKLRAALAEKVWHEYMTLAFRLDNISSIHAS